MDMLLINGHVTLRLWPEIIVIRFCAFAVDQEESGSAPPLAASIECHLASPLRSSSGNQFQGHGLVMTRGLAYQFEYSCFPRHSCSTVVSPSVSVSSSRSPPSPTTDTYSINAGPLTGIVLHTSATLGRSRSSPREIRT